MRLFALILALSSLVACGTPGAPQPPSLNIPKPVSDLKAVRKGDTVTLSWNAPQKTTDGALFRHAGKMIVKRSAGDGQAGAHVGELPLGPAYKRQEPQAETLQDSVSQLLLSSSADFATYTVEAINNSGKSAGQSNPVAVPLVLTSPPPQAIEVHVVPQGVSVSWNQTSPLDQRTSLVVQYVYRIMRRQVDSNQPPVMVKQLNAENGAVLAIDSSIEWEKQYQYWVTPVTLWQRDGLQRGEIEGDDSSVATVTTLDVFPPAVPSGLQAVSSQIGQNLFIDLTWNPNTDSDLAGYNVYRRTEETQPVKINPALVKLPTFRDDDVHSGVRYLYSVSAVDLRNNESARSPEASETVAK